MQTKKQSLHINNLRDIACTLFNLPAFLDVVNKDKPPEHHRYGGYLCFINSTGSMAITLIGHVPQEKSIQYVAYAKEKAERLRSNPSIMSSWMNRDPEAGRYGGGIRVGECILSFSGLSELADEALVLTIAADAELGHTSTLYNEIALGSGSGSDELFLEFIKILGLSAD